MARNYDEFLADLAKKQEADKAAAVAQGQPQVTAPTVAPVAPAPALAPAPAPKAKGGIPAFLLPPEPKPAAAQKKSAAPSAPKVTTKVETRKAKLPAMSQVSSEVKSGAPNAQPGAVPQPPVQREITLPPDVAKPVDWKKYYDTVGSSFFKTAKRSAAAAMGLREDELDKLAQAQGVDLESINSAKLKGRTYDEIARAARERGVLGFLPEDERLTVFRRSVEDIEKAARGEASDRQIELVKSGADQGLSGGGAAAGGMVGLAGGPVGAAVGAAAGSALGAGGYLAAGTSTELPEVSKPGEYGYLGATLLVEALQKDPTASRIYDLYGRGLATGNTQKYVEDRVADLLKRTGFAPGSAQAEEVLPKLRRRAINEVLAYKTIGQWTPAITMQDVQVTEGAAAPGFFAALGPNVELVGINNKNQAVYRQESPLGVLFRAIDIPQEALVAKLEGREAAEGIQAGSNLFEYAIEHTKDESPYVRYPAMAAGFLASVATPDLLLAGGVVQKGAKAAKRAMDIRKNGAKAIQLLETVADARQAKDYVRATTAERQLRELSPGIADQLDRYDANAAGLIEMVDPNTDILNEDMAALIGSQIPSQKEFAAQRLFLHPSARKPELSGNLPKKSVPVVTYSGLFDTDDLLKRAAEAKKSYIDNAPATIDDYAKMYARGTARDVLSDAVDKGALTPVQADEIADIVAKHAPVSLTDEQRFADLVRQEMKAHPEYGQSKYNIIRQVIYTPGKNKLRGRLDRKMTDIKGKTVAQIQAPDIALFDRVIASIEKNNEARGTGAALLRDEIAKEAKIRVQPLNLFDDVALKTPEGEPIRLSPGGVLWLQQLRRALPGQDFKEAYKEVVILDTMLVGAAKKRGVDAFDLYRELFPHTSIRKGTAEDLLRITGRAPGAPTAPAAPTMPVAARATAAAAAAPTPAAAGAAAATGPARATSPAAASAVTTFTQSAAASAAAKVAPLNLSPHGMRAASFVAELPAGMVEQDLTDVAAATQILRDIQSNRAGSGYGLAEAKLQAGIFSDARDGSIARAIAAGDVRVVVDQPKANDPFVIAVVVGDKVTRIQAPAGVDPVDSMRRGIDEAEKMMEARVKAGQPAMRGAPVEDVEVTTRLPPPSQPAATAPKTADLFERLFGSEQAMARRAEEAAETEPTVFEPTVSDVTAEIPRRRVRAELVRGEQAFQRRLAEGEEAFQRKLQRASETLAALEPTERVRPSVAAEEVLEPTAKVEAPRPAEAVFELERDLAEVKAALPKSVNDELLARNPEAVRAAEEATQRAAAGEWAESKSTSTDWRSKNMPEYTAREGEFEFRISAERSRRKGGPSVVFRVEARLAEPRVTRETSQAEWSDSLKSLEEAKAAVASDGAKRSLSLALADDVERGQGVRPLAPEAAAAPRAPAPAAGAAPTPEQLAKGDVREIPAEFALPPERLTRGDDGEWFDPRMQTSEEAEGLQYLSRPRKGRSVNEMEKLLAESGGNLAVAVRKLADTTTVPEYQAVAKRLLELEDELRPVQVDIIRPGRSEVSELFATRGSALGEFDTRSGRVRLLGPEYASRGMSEETLLHEALHAVTAKRLGYDNIWSMPEIVPASRKAISEARDDLRSIVSDLQAHVMRAEAAGTATEFERSPAMRNYILEVNGDELVSWALTNPGFQDYLKSVKLTARGTLWDRFVRMMSTLLGFEADETSALARVLEASDKLMKAPYTTPTAAQKATREAVVAALKGIGGSAKEAASRGYVEIARRARSRDRTAARRADFSARASDVAPSTAGSPLYAGGEYAGSLREAMDAGDFSPARALLRDVVAEERAKFEEYLRLIPDEPVPASGAKPATTTHAVAREEFKKLLNATESRVNAVVPEAAPAAAKAEEAVTAAPAQPTDITPAAEPPVAPGNISPRSAAFATAEEAKTAAEANRAAAETPEFKAWFGDSKVVDDDGKPLVVYHGTNVSFDTFRAGEDGVLGAGVYFSPDAEAAGKYAAARARRRGEPAVVPAYLRATNPVDTNVPPSDALVQSLRSALGDAADAPEVPETLALLADKARLGALASTEDGWIPAVLRLRGSSGGPADIREAFSRALRDSGHDGVIAKVGAQREIMVLEPNQIKSATGNVGTFSEAESSILKQVSPTGQIKGVTELMADGRSVILLFEQADASTVLHEVAHIVRRNVLDQDDMDAITKWVVSRGVKVGHQYGEFTGSANDVEQAEELFAKAFEEYVRQGVAPNSRVQAAFDALKTVIANIYRGVSDPVIGANLQPEVRQVFDKLLADVPEQANPTIKQVLRQQILGTNAREQSGFLDVLAKEAARKGLPRSSLEEVTKQFDFGEGREFARRMIEKRIAEQGETPTQAAEAIRKAFGPSASTPAAKMTDRERGIMAAVGRPGATPDPIRISFPVPVLGKKDWTIDDLAELQASREVEAAVAAKRKQGLLIDLAGGSKTAAAVPEEDAVESLRSAIAYSDDDSKLTAKSKQIARGVAATFFGGDVVGENGMRQLPPELRNAINTTVAVVEQSIGDVVSLTNDALVTGQTKELYRYLAGGGDIRRLAGRPIVSAGHDYMGSVRQMFQRTIASLSPEEQVALTKLCDALNLPAGSQRNKALETLGFDDTGATFKLADAARQKTQDEAVSAVNKLLYLKGKEKETDFGASLATAMRNAVEAPSTPRPTHEMRLVEAMSYIAGNTSRGGSLFKGDSQEAAKVFLTDVGSIYKSEDSARRMAVLIGGYGSAALGKNILVKLNLGISPDAYKAFTRWLAGENWDPRYTEEIQRIVDRYGYNPEFVADQVLASDMYIPRIARERMGEALARSVYRPSAAVTGGDAVNIAYRYMKTRMTRGSFFLRQRYFMMNTVDHFIQMAVTAGFGTAAVSVTRVLAQDLMVLPFWQQIVEMARKVPVAGGLIPRDALERARRFLQSGGDTVAGHLGTLFGASKYRIEVNPILEGIDGGFRAGGKVYRYRDIRDIAVQERVFASYDTRQLANAIEREGNLFFSPTLTGAGGTLTTATGKSRIRDFLADWQSVVSETAEAWGERERLGAMVSFMEAGYDPRTAARLVTQALYDYSQSMTKADRSMLVGILFPFWAFQKNANAQVFNTVFSPWGAYRMMCIKRARERGMEALTEILYGDVGGEYEIDVESMPPELQDSYYALITRFEESYPNGEPPPEAKRAMRMLLSGRARMVEEGKLVELAANLQLKRDQGAFADLQRFSAYAVARPSKSQRPTYMRDRTGAAIPFPRTEAMRMYYSMVGDDHSYMELFIPESSIEAGFKHLTQVSAVYMLMGSVPVDFLLGGSLKERGLDEVTLQRVLEPIADPTRSPLLAPLIAGSLEDAVPPRKVSMKMAAGAEAVKEVHPFVGKLMDDAFGTTFLRVPQIADPFVLDPSKAETMGLSPEDAQRIRELQKQFPDASVIKDQRYYIPGGVWATAFDNSPFGELNAMLLRYEANPMERNDIRGEILSWARGTMGLDVELVSPKAVIQREEPEKLKSTRKM